MTGVAQLPTVPRLNGRAAALAFEHSPVSVSLTVVKAFVGVVTVVFAGCSCPEGVSHYAEEVPVAFGEHFVIPEKPGAPAITLIPIRYNSETRECLFRAHYNAPVEPVEKWIGAGARFSEFPQMEFLHLDFVSASGKAATLRVYGARPICEKPRL